MKQKKFVKYTPTMKQVLKDGTRWIYQYISDYEIYVSNEYVLYKMTKDEFKKYCPYKNMDGIEYEPGCYECTNKEDFHLGGINLKEFFERTVNDVKDYEYHIPMKILFEHRLSESEEVGYVRPIYDSNSDHVIMVNDAFLDSIGEGITYVRSWCDPIIVSYLAEITSRIIPYAVLLPIRPDEKEVETVKFYCKYKYKEENNNG